MHEPWPEESEAPDEKANFTATGNLTFYPCIQNIDYQ